MLVTAGQEFATTGMGVPIRWFRALILRTNLREAGERILKPFLELIGNISITWEGKDSRRWNPSREGVLIVASFVEVMNNNTYYATHLNFV